MKVVIFCGGLGTRFKEETDFKPKPMINIAGKPILWHIMKIFSHYGFNDFILCAGYKNEVIKEYFYNFKMYNCDFTIDLSDSDNITFYPKTTGENWKVTVIDTGLNTLKGARLKKIEKYIDGDAFMLTYGDGVSDIDVSKLLSYHQSHNKLVTVTGVHPPSLFGELLTDESGKALMFSEKPQTTKGLINGGFFVLNKDIFSYLSDDENCDFEKGPLDKVVDDENLMVYEHLGNWSCMDSQRDQIYLEKLWNEDKAFWKVW